MLNGFHDDTHKAAMDQGWGEYTGQEISQGTVIRDFRGDAWTYLGITRVPNGASTGRVYAESTGDSAYKAELFPSVFDLVIVPRD